MQTDYRPDFRDRGKNLHALLGLWNGYWEARHG